MYPLISGIVLGGKQRLSTARALLLTFIYVQGMALTYTALGLVVAAAGLQFQAALQHPYVLIGLAIVFTLLAMSMFGLLTLQLLLAANAPHADEQSPTGRLTRRSVYYGDDCRTDLFTMHHRTA